MTGSLHGKAAVVLGCSASGGTGWAIAEALATAGARVIVAARRRGNHMTRPSRPDEMPDLPA